MAFDVPDGQGARRRILEGDALWLRERSTDGLVGVSKLERCPEVLAAARSQQQFAISVFESGATPSAIMTLPPNITTAGIKRAEAFFTSKHTGVANMRRVLFMDPESTFQPLSSTAEDSETLASRRFGGEELARVLAAIMHEGGSRGVGRGGGEHRRAPSEDVGIGAVSAALGVDELRGEIGAPAPSLR